VLLSAKDGERKRLGDVRIENLKASRAGVRASNCPPIAQKRSYKATVEAPEAALLVQLLKGVHGSVVLLVGFRALRGDSKATRAWIKVWWQHCVGSKSARQTSGCSGE
jgi:hypothetical protein